MPQWENWAKVHVGGAVAVAVTMALLPPLAHRTRREQRAVAAEQLGGGDGGFGGSGSDSMS